jgi:hypothetical protein
MRHHRHAFAAAAVFAMSAASCEYPYPVPHHVDAVATDASTVDGPPVDAGLCGNGRVDPGEVCDGPAMTESECFARGHDGGRIGCTNNCQSFDETPCSDCGDGVMESPETCDLPDWGGATCESLGFQGGSLACVGMCVRDTSNCSN